MARISDEIIQRIKKEVSVERVCTSRYGMEFKCQGKNLVGHCPWHNDKTASFIITPEKNLWNCLGECGEGGDVFRLVEKGDNVSFRRAAEILMEIAGIIPESPKIKANTKTHPILVNPDDDLTDQGLMNHVSNFYHRTFLNDPKPMKYLQKRHCYSVEAVKLFKIGHANRTLGYRVPNTTAHGKRLKGRLQGLGILRKSGHEHLSGSVVLPILNLDGQVVQMYGRKITAGLRKGTPDHLYLEQPLSGVWNGMALLHQSIWIICEAIIDALTLWCHGLRNVTASFGKNNFTKDHWELVRRIRPQKIILAYDNDSGGIKEANKLAPDLAKEGANVYRVLVPHGKDINEYVSILAQKDPKKVSDILQGLFADATLMHRAAPGQIRIAAPETVMENHTPINNNSSLAANLAAKKEAIKEKNQTLESEPAAGESGLPIAAEKTAAKEKKYTSASSNQAASLEMVNQVANVSDCQSANSFSLAAKMADIKAVVKGEDVEIAIGERLYRVRGLSKNKSFDIMKVNLRIMLSDWYHVHTFDLYDARHRSAFIKTAAEELQMKPDVIKKDIGRVLLKLEELQDEAINNMLEPKKPAYTMTEKEREEALKLLKDPSLFDRIKADFNRCGYVGEDINKIVGYIGVTSRMMDAPLAFIVQSMTAAGKTALMKAILNFMPEECRVQYSAVTGQSLFYMTETDLKHKILAIVEEKGAEQASYSLKLLQSEGELTIASTARDSNGEFVTKEYHVEGPVMIFLTTTNVEIDEELLNRCIVLTVDETREQTRRIQKQQSFEKTLEGQLLKKDRKKICKLHQNAQRLLKPIMIVNKYSPRLTFPDHCTRTRRDYLKYLYLIETITHTLQYQRPIMTALKDGNVQEYIEVILDDVDLANFFANEILGRTLDELPPQTRNLLILINKMVAEVCKKQQIERCDYRFTRRMIREYTSWGNTQLKIHLSRLEDMEYLLIHRGGRGQQFVYELMYSGEGQDGSLFFPGLIDVNKLRKKEQYDENRSGVLSDMSGLSGVLSDCGRHEVGKVSVGCRV